MRPPPPPSPPGPPPPPPFPPTPPSPPPPPPPPPSINLALVTANRTTYSSSVLDNNISLYGPQLAIDGIIPANGSSESTFMSAANDTGRWLSIDFGELVTINQIVYYNRRDCCGENVVGISFRFGGASVAPDGYLPQHNTVVFNTGISTPSRTGAVLTVNLTTPRIGRFLSFHTSGSSPAAYVAELEAYGTPAGAQRRDMHVRQLPI
ncbi:hypothetical protein PLESTB_001748300 [Pleodorina starrii]|uniref:F5/8 type C domain-containing protein n=1 Tax=Pleodorina starrii TaxID=330485 RepID=A0A9W6BZY2_9CHLO|nr:hypothetical protein PLESTM_000711600 [Pleodorina starrii]GLC61367.1 hypothetical protein PLESTB_001748300 [Pleodorina starrii]GLC67552.1 hypothetical protein PLESTF_000570000 [Pleodorina starrii]